MYQDNIRLLRGCTLRPCGHAERKGVSHITYYLLLITSILVSACSSDTVVDEQSDGMASVIVSVSTNDNTTTRVSDTSPSSWPAGTPGENMFSCMVVVTDNDNKVVQVLESGDIAETTQHTFSSMLSIAAGTYKFYSFANTSLAAPEIGSTVSYDTDTYTLNGNGFAPSASNPIPMSSVQTISVVAGEQSTVNLKVLRMLAKVELRIKNVTSQDISISSVSLTDITNNTDNNIYLLPKQTTASGDYYYVSNTQLPNANYSLFTIHYSLTLPANTTTDENATVVSFYVNESLAREPNKYFAISLTTNGGTERYAIMDWSEIARNDYRVIPITLDDYKVEFSVTQYSAIGLLPEVTYANGTLNIGFDTNGPFLITPKVTRISTGAEVSDWELANVDGYTSKFPIIEPTTGADIYYTTPDWSDTYNAIYGEMSRTPGYAIHRMNITLPSQRTVAVKVQINLNQ